MHFDGQQLQEFQELISVGPEYFQAEFTKYMLEEFKQSESSMFEAADEIATACSPAAILMRLIAWRPEDGKAAARASHPKAT